ncbi:MAG: pentapeptide repeat-containing protein [Saprospiraceae bacterium]|nr:pentapeptide repeat-containing protein [Saprospiraceae bacterium]
MKGKSYLVVGLVLGCALGWILGFLRLPHLEKNASFLLGFSAGLVLFSLVLLLLNVWKSKFLPQPTANAVFPFIRFQTILSGVMVLGSLVFGFTFYLQNKAFKQHIQRQDKKMQDMAAWVASVKQNDQKLLINSVLNDVVEALKRYPGRPLNDTTIARIAALSFACKPHPYFEGDSLSAKAYSSERGQLLQALVLLKMDTGSFAQIKRTTTFAGADLRGADLKGLALSGFNLNGANLKDADLSGANLLGSDLGNANLWGAKLNRANLSHSDLKKANLNWAQLNEATLVRANLNGANLSAAQLSKANLDHASFQWAQSDGALFNEAILTGANLEGTDLTKANLNRANLDATELRRINLSEADLVGVLVNKAIVDENWPEKLKQWQPMGLKQLQDTYAVVNDSTDALKRPLFRLKKL